MAYKVPKYTQGQLDDWLSNLKEGDSVVLYSGRGWHGYACPYVSTIKKITPTGMIRLTNNDLYDSQGRGKGSTRGAIYPYDELAKAYMSTVNLAREASDGAYNYLRDTRELMEKLDDDELRALLSIIEKVKGE